MRLLEEEIRVLTSSLRETLAPGVDIDGTAATPPAQDGRRRRHPDFAARYARMREVADLDPVAVW